MGFRFLKRPRYSLQHRGACRSREAGARGKSGGCSFASEQELSRRRGRHGSTWHTACKHGCMDTIFSVQWEHLELEHVGRFLEGAEDEPLLWECKGTELNPHDIRKEVCAFANGHEAGYLILGADEGSDGWELNGYEFKDEPPKWVSQIVRDGLRPHPVLDVRSWPVQEGSPRKVAVARVEPVATPPCFSRGTVYERVSGATIPVKEPTQLADLYGRGRAAHERAEKLAVGWANTARDDYDHELFDHGRCRLALAMCATGYKEDVSSRLFSPDYEALLKRVCRHQLVRPEGRPEGMLPPVVLSTRQWGRLAYAEDQRSTELYVGWLVNAHWSGTVALQYVTTAELVEADRLVESEVRNALSAALALVADLGGFGPYYVAVHVHGGDAISAYETRKPVDAEMLRGPTDDGPDGLIPSLTRELLRAAERTVYEEAPDKPTSPSR